MGPPPPETPAPAKPKDENSHMPHGAKHSLIALGALVGLILLVLSVHFLRRRRAKQHALRSYKDAQSNIHINSPPIGEDEICLTALPGGSKGAHRYYESPVDGQFRGHLVHGSPTKDCNSSNRGFLHAVDHPRNDHITPHLLPVTPKRVEFSFGSAVPIAPHNENYTSPWNTKAIEDSDFKGSPLQPVNSPAMEGRLSPEMQNVYTQIRYPPPKNSLPTPPPAFHSHTRHRSLGDVPRFHFPLSAAETTVPRTSQSATTRCDPASQETARAQLDGLSRVKSTDTSRSIPSISELETGHRRRSSSHRFQEPRTPRENSTPNPQMEDLDDIAVLREPARISAAGSGWFDSSGSEAENKGQRWGRKKVRIRR